MKWLYSEDFILTRSASAGTLGSKYIREIYDMALPPEAWSTDMILRSLNISARAYIESATEPNVYDSYEVSDKISILFYRADHASYQIYLPGHLAFGGEPYYENLEYKVRPEVGTRNIRIEIFYSSSDIEKVAGKTMAVGDYVYLKLNIFLEENSKEEFFKV